jgi:hypothetical protein
VYPSIVFLPSFSLKLNYGNVHTKGKDTRKETRLSKVLSYKIDPSLYILIARKKDLSCKRKNASKLCNCNIKERSFLSFYYIFLTILKRYLSESTIKNDKKNCPKNDYSLDSLISACTNYNSFCIKHSS